MKHSRFLAAAAVLVGLLGAAEVRSASAENQRSLAEFRKKSMEQRKAQGLDKSAKALFAKYPTPEVKLAPVGGGRDVLEVKVGTEATLTATGRFVPGSFAHLNCTNVEVLSQKVTEKTLEVRVRVSETALPGMCDLKVLSPVSLAYEELPAMRVVASYQWELSLANGMKARLRTATEKGSDRLTGTSEWFAKDGKSLGTRKVTVERSDENFIINVQRTAQESAAITNATTSVQQGTGAQAEKEMAALQEKMQKECMTLPPEKMGPCIDKYGKQLQAIANQATGAAESAQAQGYASAVGCDALSLRMAGGKVSGQANNCGAPGQVKVTGTVTVNK